MTSGHPLATLRVAHGWAGSAWTVLSAPGVEVHEVRHLVVPVSEEPELGIYRIR